MRPAWHRMDLETYVLASLGALMVIAIHVHGVGNVLPQTLIAITTACLLDVALRSVTTGVRMFPTGAVISALIIGLLLPEGQPWYIPLAATSLAIGSKHLLRWRGGNLFNAAAVGIVASVFLFSGQLQYGHASYLEAAPRIDYAQSYLRMEGWSFVLQGGHGWTGSTSAIVVVILGAVLVRRLRRVELVTSYLVTYVVLFVGFAGLTGQGLAVRLLLEVFATGVPFFAFFMLTDPATSPRTSRGLTIYGGFTALLSFLFRLIASPVQFLLLALLAANLVLGIQKGRSQVVSLAPADVSLAADSRRHR